VLPFRRIAPLLALAVAVIAAGAPSASAQTTRSGFSVYQIPNLTGGEQGVATFGAEGEQRLAVPAADDLWVVGGLYHGKRSPGQWPGDSHFMTPLIDHFDGHRWTLKQVSTPIGTTTFQMRGVSASSPSNVWVDGDGVARGKHFSYLTRFDGHSWHRLPLPGGTYSLLSLAAYGPKDVWVATSCRTTSENMYHWNGTSWRMSFGSDGCGGQYVYVINALFAAAPDTAWQFGAFLGSNFPTDAPENACYGLSCASVPTMTGSQIFGATGNGSDMWIVGYAKPDENPWLTDGFAAHYANGAWTNESPPIAYQNGRKLFSAAMLPNGDLWAVGTRAEYLTWFMRRAPDGTWSGEGSINFDSYGVRESAQLAQVVHVPGTASEMFAAGYRWSGLSQGRSGGFLLHHP